MSTAVAGVAATTPVETERRPHGYIPELEGIRGVALTLVVLFHVFGNGRASGGVDVFPFISGYLITRSLTARAALSSRGLIRPHYAGTLSRLVPSAAIVLVAIGLATWLWVPRPGWIQTAHEVAASAFFVENWELIHSQLSYSAAGPSTSPLQHFWSLSVQGQFFLVWPLVILAIAALARRIRRDVRGGVLVVASALTVASFAYAIWMTSVDQPVAYFSSFARVWELGLGAVVALVHPMVRIPALLRAPLGWLGLALIVSCGFVIDGAAEFPGLPTLWPILGIVLMTFGTGATGPFTTERALGNRLVLFFAAISYALYLWHWPVLVFYLGIQGHSRVGWAGACVVLSVSIGLAWLTQRFIATPLTTSRTRNRSGQRLIAMTLVVALIGGAAWAAADRLEQDRALSLAAAAQGGAEHPGAMVMLDQELERDWSAPFLPTSESAEQDLADVYHENCIQNFRNDPKYDPVLTCPPFGAQDARKTIVMSGGSHVTQWYPALQAIAAQALWQIIVVDKDGCRLSDPVIDAELGRSCGAWNSSALNVIEELKPDAIFTVATKTSADQSGESFHPGQGARWEQFVDDGIPVIAIRDTPRFTSPIPACVASAADEAVCSRPRSEIFAERAPIPAELRAEGGVAFLDLTDSFCAERCEPIIGNVLAYRDEDHMTATFARTLAPALRAALAESAPWLFT